MKASKHNNQATSNSNTAFEKKGGGWTNTDHKAQATKTPFVWIPHWGVGVETGQGH